mmetsp:Transcript_6430/g.9093  ORF Transcript_6430/g.9093 Transcript_6430/m.9093 type:complete len:1412 (+) Transcript_6430:44-4279(+)
MAALYCCGRQNDDDVENEEIPPIQYKTRPGIESPEVSANIFSKLIFWWAQPLFDRASYLHQRGKAVKHEDLIPLADFDKGDVIGRKFEKGWSKVQKNLETEQGDSPSSTQAQEEKTKMLVRSLQSSIMSVIGRRFVVAGIIKFGNSTLQFGFPLLLNALLKFIEETDTGKIDESDASWERYKGYWLSVLLLLCMAAKAVTENFYFQAVHRAGYQAKAAVSTAVYSKALRLSSAERQGTTLGELVNLMQVDATKIEMFVPQIHVLWDGLFQIIGYMAILYNLIGWPCFAGLVVMILAGPLQGVIMGKLFGLNRQLVKHTDDRVKVMNEALQGIRCVKMYSWETSFEKNIGQTRATELNFLKHVAYLRGFSRSYISALPGVVAATSFIVYSFATDETVKASTLFGALLAFDQLRFPLLFYPMALAQYAQAQVSIERISRFLGMAEVQLVARKNVPEGISGGEIKVENAEIYWSDPSIPIDKKTDDDSFLDGSSHSSTKNASGEADLTSTDDDESLSSQSQNFPKAVLKDINLRVAPGELCAVIGRVGSGKSTLCSAILNETILADGGNVSIDGSIAYAAQSPWILNASLRENILFGLPMDEDKYNEVLSICQLSHDLLMLEDGDMTEIGERGINLSGGQKQRVSVARAAYADADVIILDDPLSALDPEVGKKLFDECIVAFLKGKTRLLVTNQLQCLEHCDTVVALGKGHIIEQGGYQELMETGGEVQRILNNLKEPSEKKNSSSGGVTSDKKAPEEAVGEIEKISEVKKENETTKDVKGGNLTTEEERNVGAVKLSIYKKYLQAGGGYWRFTALFSVFILCSAITLLNGVWVSVWTSDASYERHPMSFYTSLYAATAVGLGFATFLRSYSTARFGIKASYNLHNNVLASVLRAPMSFFDTTPTGRIISRFSKDMYSIDVELCDFLDFFLFMSLSVLVSLGTIMYVTPIFGVAIVPILFVYIRILNYFREVSRETKRLESISRSPVYTHFSETLGGLSTIRAYNQATRFNETFDDVLDQNIRAYYTNKTADRWLSVRLELIGAAIAGIASLLATYVVVNDSVTGGGTSNFASLAGLSISSGITVTGLLNWGVRMFAQLEASMNSCERVLHYTENISHEAPFSSSALEAHAKSGIAKVSDPSAYAVVASGGKAVYPSNEWPVSGSITLSNLTMRYRFNTPLVLKGLDVSIAGGERIGVVGRTGSGKSSLLLCLMRIVEPELSANSTYESPITIDGVDVLRIGLNDLRTKLGIIPQNPVLFSGTVRSNLDPFDQYDDSTIWNALDKCGMKEKVESMPEELGAAVAEYGDNLSQGQRQLLCLGRALLRQCRILLLDEATSSVDFETDREIQRTLREEFVNSTVLTIAHRVNTIMDSDKILVMKDGCAAEFGAPEDLLNDEGSLFSEIVAHSKAETN